MQNTTTQWRRATQSFRKKYTSHFIWKGCVWEGVGDRTELQHIDPHSIGHNRVSFPFSWTAQLGTWGPSLSGKCSHSSIFSPTRLISKLINRCLRAPFAGFWLSLPHLVSNSSDPQLSIGGLRAPSAGCWLSLPHLVSNWSGLQTNWLPVFTELYNSSTFTFFLWASQIALIQPIHGQGYTLLFLDRMHLWFT